MKKTQTRATSGQAFVKQDGWRGKNYVGHTLLGNLVLEETKVFSRTGVWSVDKYCRRYIAISEFTQIELDVQAGVEETITWRPLKASVLNFDVSVRKIGMGFGLIVRDCSGQVLVAAMKFTESELEPREAEALAYRRAVLTMNELCIFGAEYETDCMQLYNEWNRSDKGGRSLFHGLVEETRRLDPVAGSQKLNFDKRQGNKAAHCLANLAFSLLDRCWIDKVPDQLDQILLMM
ncbi:hypothetical protein JHK86_016341 [Glycine max]|nr:hypothetical protein JHK86_016341 [Glycine max]